MGYDTISMLFFSMVFIYIAHSIFIWEPLCDIFGSELHTKLTENLEKQVVTTQVQH